MTFEQKAMAVRMVSSINEIRLVAAVMSRVLVGVAVVGGALSGWAADEPDRHRPNIVFILADDQGQHQLGCYGAEFYETPHIDRLAAEGMKFTDAYAACPVCSPTRASIMTGKYPARLHLTDYIPGSDAAAKDQKLQLPDWRKHLPQEEVTIAEVLKSVGYVTGHFGKWHLNHDKKYAPGRPGDPGSQGFDDVLTTEKPGAGPPSPYEDDAHHVREITEHALAFIETHRDRPFFCYLPHNSIHQPIAEREELIARYRSKPGSDRADHNPTVAAMAETLDAGVGRVLDKLDALGLSENTLVIYFSDNGCMWGPDVLKPLRGGKADLYEGGIRVPLLVRWPGVVAPGSMCDTPVTSIDFFPTLLECIGQKTSDSDVDGMSLLPLLRQEGTLKRDAIYWHYPHYHSLGVAPSGAIRKGRYKLIEWFEKSIDGVETPGAFELFDLASDPSEQRDLVHQRPDLARQLAHDLAEWRGHVKAQDMARNPGVRTVGGF
ncbi:MAG: sulfatase [Planctomycetaceae bacterium]|nr:sulfatase [Planctomycetaceae bacterium]